MRYRPGTTRAKQGLRFLQNMDRELGKSGD